MARRLLTLCFLLSLMVSCIIVPRLLAVDLEWTRGKELNLEVSPLDVATSADGLWIFILAPREVHVYSLKEDKVVDRIPLDETFDRLTYSAKNNTLVLSSRSEKAIRIIQLELIHSFDNSGLPFKGNESARVTVAAFGDYQ